MGARSARPPWAACVAVLAIGLSAMGCEAEREAELLEITRVTPDRLEPGRLVVVEGRGFPPGREARVRLAGFVHRPGRAPGEARVEIAGRALSASRIEARFTREALSALGGRGTLQGHVWAVFDARSGAGAVVGRSEELTLDVATASTRGLSAAVARRRRGTQVLEHLGLVVEEEAPEEPGMPVVEVVEGSVAERAGIAPGDRLVELAGVRVHVLSDAVPPPGAEDVTLRIGRRGESAPFSVRVPLVGPRDGMDRWTVTSAQIALGWVLLVLLLVAPTAGLIDAVARRTLPKRAKSRRGLRLRARLRAAWREHHGTLAVALIGLGLIGALPAIDRVAPLDLSLEAVLLGALAVRASATWIVTSSMPRARRVLALTQAFGSIAAASVALAAVATLAGTAQVFAIARSQGTLPTEWTLLRTPVAPIALGLLVWSAIHAPAAIARSAGAAARLARRLDDLVLLALTLAGTSLFLGGWGAEVEAPQARLVRAGGFVLVTWLGWLWMRRARASARWTRGSIGGAAVAGLAVVGLVALWIVAEPEPTLVEGLGHVVGAGILLAASLLIYRLGCGRLRRAPHPPQPFL